MNHQHYPFLSSTRDTIYVFVSPGKHGYIKKIVQFKALHDEIFNLGFGDLDGNSFDFNDSIVTNNGDMETVLATVVTIIERFFDNRPNAQIFITGSTPARTRLYQIVIGTNYDHLIERYEIFGYGNSVWEVFRKNVSYESFLVQKML